jgi:hypothetical protein
VDGRTARSDLAAEERSFEAEAEAEADPDASAASTVMVVGTTGRWATVVLGVLAEKLKFAVASANFNVTVLCEEGEDDDGFMAVAMGKEMGKL